MRKSRYIRKPISSMTMAERMDLAQSFTDDCDFRMTNAERAWMQCALIVSMQKMLGDPPVEKVKEVKGDEYYKRVTERWLQIRNKW